MATVYRDFALDSTGDLKIDDGDLALVADAAAIAQECKTALGLWLGEFPFDVTLGTDWQTLLSQKGVSDAQVEAEIRRVLAGVQGVVAVDSVQIGRDNQTRAASLTIAVRADTGELLTIGPIETGV